jgi:hypothetical protein
LPVAAPTALKRPIVVVDASPLLVSGRYQSSDLESYGVRIPVYAESLGSFALIAS